MSSRSWRPSAESNGNNQTETKHLFFVNGQKIQHVHSDFACPFLDCKMPGIDEMQFRARQISEISLRPRRDEGRIARPPNDERRILPLAKSRLPRRVQIDVALIILK